MLRALTAPPKQQCSYCLNEALMNTYPQGPHLPMPVCGACADR